MTNLDASPDFEDFDDPAVYSRYEAAISDIETLNMVIEFDSARACAALNIVEPTTMKKVLEPETYSRHEGSVRTRWITVWGPERQKNVVNTVGSHYGFSPRLLQLMCTDHDKPVPAVVESQQQRSSFGIMHSPRPISFKSIESHPNDIESLEMKTVSKLRAAELDLNYYHLVNEVWHFCSVDWGSRYICVGYNSLCNPQADELSLADESKKRHLGDKPLGVRYWTWLIMCNDGTIISIYENQFPHHRGILPEKDHLALNLMRRNSRNIFRQLSRANDASRRSNPIMSIPIRPGPQNVTSKDTSPSDAPSLLFHYLFDDWMTTYSLVARKEHQYGAQLEQLREKLFAKPEVDLIEDLHRVGRQLAVLKRMYQSYALIIERILGRQKPINSSTTWRPSELSSQAGVEELSRDDQTFGVSLSPSAIVRFERLRDRINLYALSEIQDCLDDKESLVFLNFNLITLKESQAVERLTRITILLAKLTILFLPVSLMTGYFSIQVVQGKYDLKTYWGAFGVIMGVSLIFLIIFGQLSGTVEGRPIYRSMTQIFYDFSKAAIGRRRKKSV